MKVLLSGFDPFGGESINPALEVVKSVADKIDDIEIKKIEIPTIFKKSVDVILKEAKEFKPDVILSIGQAAGRFDISLERIGINIDDARIKDNEGNQPTDVKIYEDGENAYFSNLPLKKIMQNLKDASIPAHISNTAGTFVCNHVLYSILYHINKNKIAKFGGFIHIPYLPEQIIEKPKTPYMEKSRAIKAIEIAIKTICKEI